LNERHPELKKLRNHNVLGAEALDNKTASRRGPPRTCQARRKLREDSEAQEGILDAQVTMALQHAQAFQRLLEIQDEQYQAECRRLEGRSFRSDTG
jgi:hypothetical protein